MGLSRLAELASDFARTSRLALGPTEPKLACKARDHPRQIQSRGEFDAPV